MKKSVIIILLLPLAGVLGCRTCGRKSGQSDVGVGNPNWLEVGGTPAEHAEISVVGLNWNDARQAILRGNSYVSGYRYIVPTASLQFPDELREILGSAGNNDLDGTYFTRLNTRRHGFGLVAYYILLDSNDTVVSCLRRTYDDFREEPFRQGPQNDFLFYDAAVGDGDCATVERLRKESCGAQCRPQMADDGAGHR